MQQTLVTGEVQVASGDYLEPIDQPATPRVPGSYRTRLENKLNDMGALAGRRGGRKSAGIPVAWVTDPKTGDAIRILVGKPPCVRELAQGELGQMKKEAAIAKRNRKNRARLFNSISAGQLSGVWDL